MSSRPVRLAPHRLLAALFLPLALYVGLRLATGSATEALALTEAVPAAWLLVVAIARRQIDPIGILSTVTVAIALAAYALTDDDPLALKLRHGAVTGILGIALLASLAFGRPVLVLIVERRARLELDERRAEIESRLSTPVYRRALVVMTLLTGLALTIDGIVQTTLALCLDTSTFVAASTLAHVIVLGGGVACVFWYFRYRYQKQRTNALGEHSRWL